MEDLKVIAPEGYEIDRENSTLDCIKFKKKEIKRPKSWDEYLKWRVTDTTHKWYHYNNCYENVSNVIFDTMDYDEFTTKEEAKAFAALGKLIQLRDVWCGDWKPDWANSDNVPKFCISMRSNDTLRDNFYCLNHILAFPTEDMRDKFYFTFHDLIEDAKMFL